MKSESNPRRPMTPHSQIANLFDQRTPHTGIQSGSGIQQSKDTHGIPHDLRTPMKSDCHLNGKPSPIPNVDNPRTPMKSESNPRRPMTPHSQIANLFDQRTPHTGIQSGSGIQFMIATLDGRGGMALTGRGDYHLNEKPSPISNVRADHCSSGGCYSRSPDCGSKRWMCSSLT